MRVFDAENRVQQTLDAQQRATAFEHDAEGNQTALVDALGTRSESTYDALGRLIQTLQDVGGIETSTGFEYDANDQLRKVVDPKGLATGYTYDGMGNLTRLSSPDTGVTTYQYDVAGNRTRQTDARGVTADYRYDALNRLVAIDYPQTALDIGFGYEEADIATDCTGSAYIGRLTSVRDGSSRTTYCYDARGRISRKQQSTGATTLSVGYRYTLNGRISGITLPSGLEIAYAHDAQGRIAGVSVEDAANPSDVDLVSGVAYLPFGPIARIDYANGHQQRRTFDANYWSTGVQAEPAGEGLQLSFGHDALGNITTLQGGTSPQTYAYDALSRLTEVRGTDGLQQHSYSYDATGNRLSARNGNAGDPDAYVYAATSHRLQKVAGIARAYDAAGNTTLLTNASGALTMTYGDDGRLSEARDGATPIAIYAYNGRGERVRKQTADADLVFVYDKAGHLLGECADGVAVREYVWMDDLPVGVIADGHVYAIESDHLGTPRRVFDPETKRTVWQWSFDGEPFGEDAASVPDRGIELPLRFPGNTSISKLGSTTTICEATTLQPVDSRKAALSA